MQNDNAQGQIYLTTEQWTTLSDLFGLEDKSQHVNRIRDLIASGFPVYGKTDFGINKFNLAELAACHESWDLVLYLQQTYPELVNESTHVLHYMFADEGTLARLVAGGYPMAKIIESDLSLMGEVCNAWGMGQSNLHVLVEHGLDLNAVATIQGEQMLPFTWLGRVHRTNLIDRFLAEGAKPDALDADGRHFLHHAVTEGRTKRTDRDDAEFSTKNLREILAIATSHGINIDIQDKDGNSPLHLAAKMGYENKVMALVEYGASTTLRNNKGKTPAQLAEAAKRTGVVRLLSVDAARQAIIKIAAAAGGPQP
jgi:hypothetical protein